MIGELKMLLKQLNAGVVGDAIIAKWRDDYAFVPIEPPPA